MSAIYLATLGQAPEAITFALDKLMAEGNRYECIGILHTNTALSKIGESYERLMPILERDYGKYSRVTAHELAYADGSPLVDVEDERSARGYFRALGTVLAEYKRQRYGVHLLVSGGRKAMSIYAMIAAGIVFNPPQDRVYTVLSAEHLIAREGQWHVPPGDWHRVQMVSLPFIPLRRIPSGDVSDYFEIESFPNPHGQFIRNLTGEEIALVRMLERYPYVSNRELGEKLGKSAKTINNQLSGIYGKMQQFYDFGGDLADDAKRIALLDILREGA